jgi:heme-binding protein
LAAARLRRHYFTLAATASAPPDPCAASTVAKTVGSVATSTGTYHPETHPETNQA